MIFHDLLRPAVGLDVSRPAPMYRPRWLFRSPDYFVNLHKLSYILSKLRSMLSSVGRPDRAIASLSSLRRISSTWYTPSAPSAASPQRTGRPTSTAPPPKSQPL